ncbi:ATP-binding protein [Streptomyces sp. TS71-3]|uniref:ATP-binding protein n=1 Tax=Streptomyces sp. TS71-3 TaxID=2733862 RepID=UPI001BB45C95|nr:ATP-binding protein [Streptomyces sp. TS71-3]
MSEAEVQARDRPEPPDAHDVRAAAHDVRTTVHEVRPSAIAQARDLARRRLRGFDARLVDDCLLVVSELVTNAVRHGGGLVGFDVTARPGHVTVSVRDRSTTLPSTIPPTGQWLPGGYGWPMVCRLAKKITISMPPGGGKAIHVSIG